MLFIKLILIATLAAIFYQDYRSRMVSAFLFPLAASLFGTLHFLHTDRYVFLISCGINMMFIAVILLILYLYTTLKLKKRFINTSFGIGDLWFFVAVGVGFPTVTFAILFVFSVLFALVLHLLFKQKTQSPALPGIENTYTFTDEKMNTNKHLKKSVPLAGYMSLFFALILSVSAFSNFPSLYLM
ncbi:hypothetical protein [Sinomicrobium weinanense]|uniref:Prepilin type IV endopeptidase peptidase domain-containing protein n=1 Tax=Sinomicrobium weinanense TaxID=2842200 RepID=A0A926JQW8_9FLAO|nr:hypothetical protein [Sinomicrobium weinanense]MBC9795842.1 hypothetical protein [Sinomicrobium weinanense]MBU3125362.1 hypothetical protein [Sinomicrobium weinanense]